MRVFFNSMIFLLHLLRHILTNFMSRSPPLAFIRSSEMNLFMVISWWQIVLSKKRNPCILLVNIYLVYIPRFKKYFCSQCFLDIIGMQINKLVINNKSCWHNQKPGILGVILNPSRRSIKMHSIVWPVSAFK